MWIIIFIALLFFPGVSRSAEGKVVSVSLGEGKTFELLSGTATLVSGGKSLWSKKVFSALSSELKESAKIIDLADGFRAIHTVSQDEKNRTEEAVLLFGPGKPGIELLWNARTDLSGDPGERSAEAVRFEDLNGDSLPEIVKGTISEAHRLCGIAELPLLFRQVFDLKTGKFRQVLAKRKALSPAMDLQGTLTLQGDATTPLIRQVSAESASRSSGDKADILFLAKPGAAVDENPATLWTPGIGNGAGEFITLHLASDVYGITRIGIRPLPTPRGKVAYDRPKTLLLSTEKKVYRFLFNEDPALSPEAMIWFTLPSAEKTACLSMAVEQTYDDKTSASVSVSEITVLTEVDEKGGIDRLAFDLNTADKRRQAAMLLQAAGPRAVPAIRGMFEKLNRFGRRLAVEVLARTDAEGCMDLLAAAAVDSDKLTQQAALEGIRRAPDKAAFALAKYLSDTNEKKFAAAADTLAALGTKSAVKALTDRLGKTDRKRRHLLISRITAVVSDTPEDTSDLWHAAEVAQAAGERDRLLALLETAAALTSLQDKVFDAAGPLFDAATDFAERYRLLEVLGRVSCGRDLGRVVSAATDADVQIRSAAVRGAGQCISNDAALGTVVAGLEDKETAVRLAALDALYAGTIANLKLPLEQISTLAHADPWPKVRAKAVRLSGIFPRDRVLSFLAPAARDRSQDVRETALITVFQYFGKDADAVIEERLVAPDETDKLKALAAAAAGKRCQKSAMNALFELLVRGAEPMADAGKQEVAAQAARALGDIGGPEAISMLKDAAKRSNISTDKAIDAALKNPGAACSSAESFKTVGPKPKTEGETP